MDNLALCNKGVKIQIGQENRGLPKIEAGPVNTKLKLDCGQLPIDSDDNKISTIFEPSVNQKTSLYNNSATNRHIELNEINDNQISRHLNVANRLQHSDVFEITVNNELPGDDQELIGPDRSLQNDLLQEDLSSSESNNYYEHIQPVRNFNQHNHHHDLQRTSLYEVHNTQLPYQLPASQSSTSTPQPAQRSGLSTTISQAIYVNPSSRATREQFHPARAQATGYMIMQQVAQPLAQPAQAPTRWQHFSNSLINLISYNTGTTANNKLNATLDSLQVGPLRKALLGLQNPKLLGGDILLKTSNQRGQSGRLIKFERSALVSPINLWPNGVIYYELDASVYHLLDLIWSVMQQFHSETCIKFIPRENNEPDYLRIEALKGCFSYIGRIGGEQTLSLGDGCEYRGTITHELLHAVGFFHHQNRSDRDDFLEILWDNIAKGKENQFLKMAPQENILLNDFDYNSIMLYGPRTFGKTLDKVTMKPKREGVILLEVVEKKGLSTLDISSVNKLYKCQASSYD